MNQNNPAQALTKEDEEQIREWSRQLLPRASAEQVESMLSSIRCLMEETLAGEERRAIMNLLMRHDAVRASDLRRLCSADPEARIAEMRQAGIHIERRNEQSPGGLAETAYTCGTPQFVRAMRMVFGKPGDSTRAM